MPAKYYRSIPSAGLSFAALAATGFAILGIGLMNTDSLIERSFADALSGPAVGAANKARNSGPAVAGTEEFWLGSQLPAGASRVSWVKGTSVGDRILIGPAGSDRALEIIDLHELPADMKSFGKVSLSGQLVLVTAREQGVRDAQPVQFIVDAHALRASLKANASPDAL